MTALLWLLLACTGEVVAPATDVAVVTESAPAPALTAEDQKTVGLAKQIQSDPAQADTVLSGAGLDRAAFEAQLFAIAADPTRSAAYSAAMGR